MSEITQDGMVMVVKPGQDVVASFVEAFKLELKKVVSENAAVAIDLAGVEMLDSMGIGVLIATHNSLKKKGAKLEIRNVPPEILRLLQNMRLSDHFKISS